MLAQQIVVPVSDISQVGAARRTMAQLTRDGGLDETEGGRAAIIVTELATNLVRHAHGGEMLLGLFDNGSTRYVDAMAIDRGPGMLDVRKCLQDGFSQGGTAGSGLGAVRRLSSEFDIYSTPAAGTVVYSRISAGKAAVPVTTPPLFRWGVASRPLSAGEHSGDCWRIAERPDQLSVMVADGLGHGTGAAEASGRAATAFEREPFLAAPQFMEKAHAQLQGSRGAAVATARIDGKSGEIRYAGVGNISGHLEPLDGKLGSQGLMSHNGIVGVNQRKVTELVYPSSPETLLIMYSDGLRSRWALADYAGLMVRHPALIAGVLFRDYSRGRDDVAVVVIRVSRSNQAKS